MFAFLKFFRQIPGSLALARARRAATEALAEKDTALDALFDAGMAGMSVVDLQTGRFVRVSRRFCEILRRDAADLLAKGPSDIIHPDAREGVRTQWMSAMHGSGSWEAEVRHVAPDGGVIFAFVSVSVWQRDESGAPIRCIAVVQDISDNVRAMERLRVSEEMLLLGHRIGRIGSFSRDVRTGLIECDAQSREVIGLPPGDEPLPTEIWLATTLPEDRAEIVAIIRRAIARGDAEVSLEYRTRGRDGALRTMQMRARYTYDEQGAALRSVGVAIDVTEMKQVEKRLRASETLLRMGMEIGQIGAFRRDLTRDGEIECGQETRALHGLPSGDAPIPAAAWLATLEPADAERVVAEIRSALDMRMPVLETHYRFRRAPGEALRHMEGRTRYEYDDDGRPLASVGVLIDVTDRVEAQNQLAHAANHDALTGLPNRLLFCARMEEALARGRRGENFAVLCLDLDRFKEVNDTLGHHVGDLLLVEVARRLREELREMDTLARLGGDEFAVIQADLKTADDSAALARRLVARVAEPFVVDGRQVVVGLSIGIAIAPHDGAQHDDLLKAADMALYGAKAQGRGGWRYFEPEMNARMQMRRALELDIRRALERDEFVLFYQPIIDISSRKIKSFEALIRWRHPERGILAPDVFIPLCEELGLIRPLGAWVLRRACAEAARWPRVVGVAVNLSPVQFQGRNLVETVAAALTNAGLSAERLELEITESVMLQDTATTLETLHGLKRLGVRIAMDDFGTGYSSLSYLQSFPFDKVKIDRSFTQGLDRSRQSDAIVKAVTDLCEGLDMCTTAEGVETEEQFRALARTGCREAQGYLFSPARAAEDIPMLFEQFGFAKPLPQAAE